jgi:hypothetical protein
VTCLFDSCMALLYIAIYLFYPRQLYIVRVCHYMDCCSVHVCCKCGYLRRFAGPRSNDVMGIPQPSENRETVDAKMPPKTSFRRIFFAHNTLINNLHIFTHHVIHGLTKVQRDCDKKRPYSQVCHYTDCCSMHVCCKCGYLRRFAGPRSNDVMGIPQPSENTETVYAKMPPKTSFRRIFFAHNCCSVHVCCKCGCLPVLDRMTSWGFPNHPKIDRETVDANMPSMFVVIDLLIIYCLFLAFLQSWCQISISNLFQCLHPQKKTLPCKMRMSEKPKNLSSSILMHL